MFLPDDGSSTPIHTTHITRDRSKHIYNEIPLTFGKKKEEEGNERKRHKLISV